MYCSALAWSNTAYTPGEVGSCAVLPSSATSRIRGAELMLGTAGAAAVEGVAEGEEAARTRPRLLLTAPANLLRAWVQWACCACILTACIVLRRPLQA